MYFIGNPHLPTFVLSGTVDVHAFRDIGDYQTEVFHQYNITNPTNGYPGTLLVQVTDNWFNNVWTGGMNFSDPFYFTIAPSGTIPIRQNDFRATREYQSSSSFVNSCHIDYAMCHTETG